MAKPETVVDYDAWNKGYTPPSEHILIDQLAYRGARVVMMCDHSKDGAFWIVARGIPLTPKMRKHMRNMMEIMFPENEETEDAAVATAEQGDGSVRINGEPVSRTDPQ